MESTIYAKLKALPQDVECRLVDTRFANVNYEEAMDNCAKNDIAISCRFLNGYIDNDADCIDANWEFANSFQFFNCSYINLIPIHRIPAYQKLRDEIRLVDEKWWLKDIIYTKQAVYYTDTLSEEDMIHFGNNYCKRFFSMKNIFHRFIHSKYRLKMRFVILIANVFAKYFFKVVGS